LLRDEKSPEDIDACEYIKTSDCRGNERGKIDLGHGAGGGEKAQTRIARQLKEGSLIASK